jgi:uncharacterized protein
MLLLIARNIAQQITAQTELPPLLVLNGPRGVGKTYLSQVLFPTHRRASLSLPTEAARAQLDPAAFLAGLPPPVVIDDVHLAPRLVHHVAREIRARPCPPAGYVLVGSRPLTLAAAADEASDGGDICLRVDGLSHAEISAARPDLSIEQRLLRGGFPAIYADPEADVGEFMRALVADHLARELPLQLRVDSVHDFERFLRAAACRTGRLLNKAELAREIGIAGSTAAIWLDTLTEAGVITLVQPWRPPQGKPLVKAPKLFFLDTGLCAALLGIRDEQHLAASPHAAALWETAVHAELRRLLAATAPQAELAFWRDRTKEVDFVLPTRRGLALLDASWTEFSPPGTASRLLRIRDLVGPGQVATLAVVCHSPHGQSLRQPAGPDVETVGLDDLPTLLG